MRSINSNFKQSYIYLIKNSKLAKYYILTLIFLGYYVIKSKERKKEIVVFIILAIFQISVLSYLVYQGRLPDRVIVPLFTYLPYIFIPFMLFTCAVYTRGISWFLTVAIGVLMGYVAVFVPALLKRTNYTRYKYIMSFTALFLLTVLMMMHIRLWQPFMLGNAMRLAAYGFVPVIACAVICAFRLNAFLKAGICTAIIGITLYCANHVIAALFGPPDHKPYQVDFQNWEQCLDGNVQFIMLMLFLLVSVILLMIGFFRVRRNKQR